MEEAERMHLMAEVLQGKKKEQVWNRFSVMSPLLVVDVFFYSDNFVIWYCGKTLNDITSESMNY